MRVCIVGSGVVGGSIAFRLAQAEGVDVTVIDANGPGTGTTAVSFAWVNASNKRPRSYFELNYAGLREYQRLSNEWGSSAWLNPGGCLTTRGHAPDIDEHVELLRSWGYDAELLAAREVTATLEPAVDLGDPDMPVGYFPQEFGVDAVALTRSFIDGAARRGANCHYGVAVTGIASEGDQFLLTLADGTSLRSDVVVNAAGANADIVGSFLDVPVPLAPTWGMVALLRAENHSIRRVIHTADVDLRREGCHMLRLHHTPIDDLLIQGNVNRSDLAHDLRRRVVELVPSLRDAYVVNSIVGVRPIPADEVSCVGAVPEVPGYFEAVTHSGVTLGPLLGRLLATEILTGKVDPLVEPFRPDRFSRH